MFLRALGAGAAVAVSCAFVAAPARGGAGPDLPDLPPAPAIPSLPAPDVPPAPVVPALDDDPAGGAGVPELPGLSPAPAPAGALAPPVAFTGAVTPAGAGRAEATGLVVPGGAPVTYAFEHGPTARYGTLTAPVTLPAGNGPVAVRASLSGLTAEAPVHARLVVRSAAGTATGEDRVGLPGASPAAERRLAREARGARPGADVRLTPAAGSLQVLTRSGSVPVTGVRVRLGTRGAAVAQLACAQRPGGPLRSGGAGQFALALAGTGAQDVRVDLLGGGCDEPARVLRTLRTRATPAARGSQAPPEPPPASCPDADLRPDRRNAARVERAVVCLLGLERQAAGLGPLEPSPRLARAARRHVGDMLRHGYLGHRRRGGPGLGSRLRAVGYGGRAGEAITVGAGRLATPAATVRGWMASAVHRAVVLRPGYRAAGVGVRPGAPVRVAGRAATYTAVLGTRR